MEPVDNGNEGRRRLDWTKELHYKFLDVVNILGGIRGQDTVPNNILKLMNEPGLTRAQVASHLQKYRQNKENRWQRRNKLVRHNELYENLIQQSYQLDYASSSYNSNDDVFSYEPDESMFNSMQNQPCWNAMQGNNDQTWIPFVENENLQVEGSSYPMSQVGGYIIPNNEDNNSSYSPYSAQSMDQEIASQMSFVGDDENYNNYYPWDLLTFKDNSVRQDHSGGNHIMVDHSLLSGENHSSSSYHSYSVEVGQQQFPVPLLSESDIYSNLEPIMKLPTFNDNIIEQDCSSDNHMVDFINNFDSQVNVDEWPPTYSANWQ